MADEDAGVRLATLSLLMKRSTIQLLPHIESLMMDKNIWVRASVAKAIGLQRSPVAKPHLMTLINDKVGVVQIAAIEALAQFGDRAALPAILNLTTSKDSDVKKAAITALGQLGDSKVVEMVQSFLTDPHWGIRLAATQCLGRLKAITARERVGTAGTAGRGSSGPTDRPVCTGATGRACLMQMNEELVGVEKQIELPVDVFRILRDMLYEQSGVYLNDNSKFFLESRLQHSVRRRQFDNFKRDYYYFLKYDRKKDEELTNFIDLLTIHETFFFREERQLKAFSEEILPELAERKKKLRSLRIWSAGCSTGEEPYTIAMLIAEQDALKGWDIEIFASDIHSPAGSSIGASGDLSTFTAFGPPILDII